MNIRLANAGDIDELEQLYDALNDYLAAHTNYPGWKKGVYPTREDAASGFADKCLFVAEAEGQIAGSIILRREPEPAYLKARWLREIPWDRALFLHTFVVRPQWMCRGVGARLLAFAGAYGLRENMLSLRLDVYEKNLPAIRLYERCGFQYTDTVSMGLESRGLNWFKLYEKPLNP